VAHLDADALRAEVRGWLAANWDPELPLAAWRARLADAGWARPSWPTAWFGRDLPRGADDVVADVLAEVGAVGPPDGVGTHLAAPTLLAHGDDALRRRLLRPTLVGSLGWCQLFSEPGAGSDLAGLTTRAARDRDVWVVDGQKVWTTSAHHADVGLLLARTDVDVPKHAGLTCFVLPMHQRGVEVRPLRQMNGHASFNEVFFDGAVVPDDHRVGAVGGGWTVALTTLMHERRLASLTRGRPPVGAEGRVAREALAEHERVAAPYRWYPQRAGRPDLLADRLREGAGVGGAVHRDRAVAALALARIARLTVARASSARAAGTPGPEGSLAKLASSEIARAAARAHGAIAGASGTLAAPDAPLDGLVTEILCSAPAISIAGGTDEIQRTILGERVLGLPKEPDDARDLPFAAYPTNAVPRRDRR
jgi:alkylation response protein AidB-like acyl-CoA dehydrogenase